MTIDREFITEHLGTELLTKALATDVELSRREGEDTAYSWKDDYRPGGPFHYGSKTWESAQIKILSKHSNDCYAAWMEGFDRIIAARGYKYANKD